MYQGIRIFASNLKENMAQRFYNLVLLPRVRDDIDEYKKLNFHLYQALKKALFKPGAFMKGILIPLCEVLIYKERMSSMVLIIFIIFLFRVVRVLCVKQSLLDQL